MVNAGDWRFKSSVVSLEPSHTEASDRGLLDSTGAAAASEPKALTRSDGVHRNKIRSAGSEKELPRKGRLVNAGAWRFKSSVVALGAFPTGLCRSCTYSLGYVSCSRPGARAPARSDGEYRPGNKTRVQERHGSGSKWAAQGAAGYDVKRDHRGAPTTGGTWGQEQLLRDQRSCSAVPPIARPTASEYPPTLGSHGAPQWDRSGAPTSSSRSGQKGRS